MNIFSRTKPKLWLAVQPEDTELETHVIPLDDIVDHTPVCVCGPTCEPQSDEDGMVRGFLYIHHSLDNRETDELDQNIVTAQWVRSSASFLVQALMQPGSPRDRVREFWMVAKVLKKKGIPRAGKLELDSEKEAKQ